MLQVGCSCAAVYSGLDSSCSAGHEACPLSRRKRPIVSWAYELVRVRDFWKAAAVGAGEGAWNGLSLHATNW